MLHGFRSISAFPAMLLAPTDFHCLSQRADSKRIQINILSMSVAREEISEPNNKCYWILKLSN